MKTITLTLTIDEANQILAGLGRLPFAKVYALVAKIQQQAKPQVGNGSQRVSPEPTLPAQIEADEADGADHVQ